MPEAVVSRSPCQPSTVDQVESAFCHCTAIQAVSGAPGTTAEIVAESSAQAGCATTMLEASASAPIPRAAQILTGASFQMFMLSP